MNGKVGTDAKMLEFVNEYSIKDEHKGLVVELVGLFCSYPLSDVKGNIDVLKEIRII